MIERYKYQQAKQTAMKFILNSMRPSVPKTKTSKKEDRSGVETESQDIRFFISVLVSISGDMKRGEGGLCFVLISSLSSHAAQGVNSRLTMLAMVSTIRRAAGAAEGSAPLFF